MQLNLNDPSQFTLEGVKNLIASKDDSAPRQIRVTKEGMAYVSDLVGNIETNNLAFRLPTLDRGNDYVGISASQDESWVLSVYNALKNNWPNPSSEYIEVF